MTATKVPRQVAVTFPPDSSVASTVDMMADARPAFRLSDGKRLPRRGLHHCRRYSGGRARSCGARVRPRSRLRIQPSTVRSRSTRAPKTRNSSSRTMPEITPESVRQVAAPDRDELGLAPLDACPAGHPGEAMAALAHLDAECLQHLAHDGLWDQAASMAVHDRTIPHEPPDHAISSTPIRSNHALTRVAITFDDGAPAGDRP